MEAAEAGAVVEFRFNGEQAVPSVRIGNKPLILRAAPGFEPVLINSSPQAPVLLTRAALVLEGLTLINRQNSSGPPVQPGSPGGTGIWAKNALFLASHCRFVVELDANVVHHPPPTCVRLENVSWAWFDDCEFVSREGLTISWIGGNSVSSIPTTNYLTVRGCTVYGNFVNRNGPPSLCNQLNLLGNTFCGDSLIRLVWAAPDVPIQVAASNNVFAMDKLVLRVPLRAGDCALERVIRWNGSSNAYAVETDYVACDPFVTTHAEWLASDVIDEIVSASGDLNIRERLDALANNTRATEDEAFILSAEEQQQLATRSLSMVQGLGANAGQNGPGKPYDDWRASPAYQEWLELVREHLPEVADNE